MLLLLLTALLLGLVLDLLGDRLLLLFVLAFSSGGSRQRLLQDLQDHVIGDLLVCFVFRKIRRWGCRESGQTIFRDGCGGCQLVGSDAHALWLAKVGGGGYMAEERRGWL